MVFLKNIKLGLKGLSNILIGKKSVEPLAVFEKDGRAILLLGKRSALDRAETAFSEDGFSFEALSKTIPLPQKWPDFPKAVVLPRFRFRRRQVMFFGDRSIKIAYSSGSNVWKTRHTPLLAASAPIELANVFVRKDGLLVLYYEKTVENKLTYYSAYLALFDKKNPSRLIWRTKKPVWRHKDLWPDQKARPLGAIFLKNQLITYWYVGGKIIYGVVLAGFTYDPRHILRGKGELKRYPNNPIIAPRPQHSWEAFNTFNPAALYAGDKVNILYRAQGFDYISTVGYASSYDGITINERLDKPIYTPRVDFENNTDGLVNDEFTSGGGFGGCEDPRITRIDKRVYMVYVAFCGWAPPRLALTSILLKDFLNKRWLWSKPVLISPPGVIDKSGCLLPEKINGKYVFFHRVFPNILVDFVDDLIFDGKTRWLEGKYQIKIRPDKWDSRKIGAGAPPLKTKDGWLLIYYGVDDRDAGKYHIGAMLLDLNNPVKVLYRTDEPILSPTKDYENNGFKPGIIYPCGAIIVKNQLLVYYGGADSVVCVATANLSTFLEQLKSHKPVHLSPVQVKEVTL